MAINEDGVFNPKGYYAQATIVNEHLTALHAKDILEVGCGKGFNSIFLAQNNQDVKFTGLDLTPLHITLAKEKAGELANVQFEIGNFHELSFADNSFDVVFGVETLCHATDISQVFREFYRVLRPGGRCIIFDAFRTVKITDVEPEVKNAIKLVEKTMAVEEFAMLEEWLDKSQAAGLNVMEVHDLTQAVLPTMLKLKRSAQKYFKHTWLAILVYAIFPKHLIRNSVAGLLMPYTFGEGLHLYHKLVLTKPK